MTGSTTLNRPSNVVRRPRIWTPAQWWALYVIVMVHGDELPDCIWRQILVAVEEQLSFEPHPPTGRELETLFGGES